MSTIHKNRCSTIRSLVKLIGSSYSIIKIIDQDGNEVEYRNDDRFTIPDSALDIKISHMSMYHRYILNKLYTICEFTKL